MWPEHFNITVLKLQVSMYSSQHTNTILRARKKSHLVVQDRYSGGSRLSDKGRGGGSHPDPEIKEGAVFRPQFGLQIRV